jgi:hypothetical protein
MGIVEKLNEIGIKQGHAADILLSSSEQLRLIHDYGIDTKKDKFAKYRCLISPNTGSRKYRAPILGHTRESMLPASSLQLGIFNLLYFDNVVPLNPTERRKPKNSFELKLFKIPRDKFDLRDLSFRYNLQKVYCNFLDIDDDFKVDQAKLIAAYESRTYDEFRKVLKIGKKAFENKLTDFHVPEYPRIEVIERIDEESINEFKVLMAARSPFNQV